MEQINLKIKVYTDPETNSIQKDIPTLSKNHLWRLQTRRKINNFEPEVPCHLYLYLMQLVTVALDCAINFFFPDFPRFLMGILHKTTRRKAVFSPCRATEAPFGGFVPGAPPKPASAMGLLSATQL